MAYFDVFSLIWNVKNVNVDLMVNVKTSLKDLSIALNNHGWHGLFSFLSS